MKPLPIFQPAGGVFNTWYTCGAVQAGAHVTQLNQTPRHVACHRATCVLDARELATCSAHHTLSRRKDSKAQGQADTVPRSSSPATEAAHVTAVAIHHAHTPCHAHCPELSWSCTQHRSRDAAGRHTDSVGQTHIHAHTGCNAIVARTLSLCGCFATNASSSLRKRMSSSVMLPYTRLT